jgi:hypothetical protein
MQLTSHMPNNNNPAAVNFDVVLVAYAALICIVWQVWSGDTSHITLT